MSFVTLDNKNWCKGIYHEGNLHFDKIPASISRTWKYVPYLEKYNVEYASLYVYGKTIDEVCPAHLKANWEKYSKKLKAYYNSFVEAKVNLDDNCFYDLIPSQFLLEFCSTKAEIISFLIENNKKPKNYDHLLMIEKIATGIAQQTLKINLSSLKKEISNNRVRTLYQRLLKTRNFVEYDIFGSKTGRLTTTKNSFPILNLDSKYRFIIEPTNDAFVELDYNAAEARVLLGLAGQQQPKDDIHDWNAKKFGISREQAKQEIFSWLYGSTKVDSSKFENLFQLNKIKDRYYDGHKITNFYERQIEADEFHSLNYLVQSTTNDLVLKQVYKIKEMLKNKKSFISFTVHDSVVLDLAKEDRELIIDIISEFSKTDLGNFPVNISVGKDYGNLRKIKCL